MTKTKDREYWRKNKESWITETEARSRIERKAEKEKLEWMKSRGVKKCRDSNPCYLRLFGKRCNHDLSTGCLPPGADHSTLWARDGKPVTIVTQPYPMIFSSLKKLIEWCEVRGLEGSISAWPAWHNPGGVLHIEIEVAKS